MKFVLPLDFDEKILTDHAAVFEILNIQQGYLLSEEDGCVRVRQTNTNKFKLCYKQKVANRLIEIEKRINHQDFNDLWEIAHCKLRKIRYNLAVTSTEYWSIDFYKNAKNQTYFVLAEHEMPEGQTKPNSIPSIIDSKIVYKVAQSDNRFTARKLSNIKYAKKFYSKL